MVEMIKVSKVCPTNTSSHQSSYKSSGIVVSIFELDTPIALSLALYFLKYICNIIKLKKKHH